MPANYTEERQVLGREDRFTHRYVAAHKEAASSLKGKVQGFHTWYGREWGGVRTGFSGKNKYVLNGFLKEQTGNNEVCDDLICGVGVLVPSPSWQ